MSFILEAQRRDNASDPRAAARAAMAEHRRSRIRWLGIAAGAIALIALGAGAYHLLSTESADPPRTAVPGISQPGASRELVVRPRERTGPPQRDSEPQRPKPRQQATTTSAPAPAAAGGGAGRVLSPEQAAELNIGMPEAADEATPSLRPGEVAIGPDSGPSFQPPAPGAAEAAAAAPPVAGKVITREELPEADRAAFPKLEFSTHIFSDDPEMRAVVVNARRLQEGQSLGEMVLKAVTEDGIIVDYRGHQVALSVVDSWE